MGAVILFDGDCNFCNQSVQFIIKRDPIGYFKFASLQGQNGERLRDDLKIPANIDSLVLIEEKRFYLQSTAALRICAKLKMPWSLLVVLIFVPSRFRDYIYENVAKNRYKWFGKKESCIIPSPDVRKRFLD